MSVNGIGGSMGYNPYVVMNSSQQAQGIQKSQSGSQPKTQTQKPDNENGLKGPDGDGDADDGGAQFSFAGIGSNSGSDIYNFIQNLGSNAGVVSSGALYA